MDIGWDGPPEEDIDALLDDEDELEYIREIELQNKQKEVLDIEKLLESNSQVITQENVRYIVKINHYESNISYSIFYFYTVKRIQIP